MERRSSKPYHLDGVSFSTLCAETAMTNGKTDFNARSPRWGFSGFHVVAPDVGLNRMPYNVGLEPFAASSEQVNEYGCTPSHLCCGVWLAEHLDKVRSHDALKIWV